MQGSPGFPFASRPAQGRPGADDDDALVLRVLEDLACSGWVATVRYQDNAFVCEAERNGGRVVSEPCALRRDAVIQVAARLLVRAVRH